MCCGTKRQVEIDCPADCAHLGAAQKHPAAVVTRQLDRDIATLMSTLGPLSAQQVQLFFLLQTTVLRHRPDSLARVVDADLALAAGALATSLETAGRGVIYEESTASIVAEGLRRALKPLVDELTKRGGSRAERDIAAVLRGIERGARHGQGEAGSGERSYLDLVARVVQDRSPATQSPAAPLIIAP